MNRKLTSSQIGQKIARIRKQKGYSQAELARHTGISRSSYAQIELGNRSLNILEFQSISELLGFSMDEFMSSEYSIPEQVNLVLEEKAVAYGERISTPALKKHVVPQVLVYLLEKCAGKPNIGESMLNPLLYFLDFNYYELYETQLTGMTYRKRSESPVSVQLDSLISQLTKQNRLQKIKTIYFGRVQTRYLPLIKADLSILQASEKHVIDRLIDQYSDWSADTLYNYASRDMPLMATEEGKIIDYELVFYREAPYTVRNYDSLTETEG